MNGLRLIATGLCSAMSCVLAIGRASAQCPGPGDCCIAHINPGCENTACCQQVCAQLPLCCITTWSQNCADAAQDQGCCLNDDFEATGLIFERTGPDTYIVDAFLTLALSGEADLPLHSRLLVNGDVVAEDLARSAKEAGPGCATNPGCPPRFCQVDVTHENTLGMYRGKCFPIIFWCVCITAPPITQSFHTALVIPPGSTVELQVDPDHLVSETNEANNTFSMVFGPGVVIIAGLDNPMSPIPSPGGDVVFSQSGTGDVWSIPSQGGRVTPLISDFGMDNYAGFNISCQGLAYAPCGRLYVASSAGPGNIVHFDPATFPTTADTGTFIPASPVMGENPFDIVFTQDGTNAFFTGGTEDTCKPPPPPPPPPPPQECLIEQLVPFYQQSNGATGLGVDPATGLVYGAYFGSFPNDGEILRWNPDGLTPPQLVADQFTNLVDIAFTPDGRLIACEFGQFGVAGTGRILHVATDGSNDRSVLVDGLDNPSSIQVDALNRLFVTEFGVPINGGKGKLYYLELAELLCQWDCGVLNGAVDITDFLALLGQWGGPGSCDFNGGGVGITDFLKLLANWGPCP